MIRDNAQLSLSLFDTTSLSTGLTLGASQESTFVAATSRDDDDTPAATNSQPRGANFRLPGDRELARSWKARAADNLAAIRLSQQLAAEQRPPTPEEQMALSRFVGFGASELANTLFRRAGQAVKDGWEDLAGTLEQLVSREDIASLARATQYAHYTPEPIVRAIWHGLERLGFNGGRILEPGCGTGLFFALMPEVIAAQSALTGIEMDGTTARIASLLYPEAWIRHEDFTKARLPELFDLAIGNPPFSDRTVRGSDPAGALGLPLHDYFIARSIERLRPGGLAAFVTSRWTLDKTDGSGRAHVAGMADLVAAFRLPQGSMMETAGTDVVADVLFFRKRHGDEAPAGAAWDDLGEAVPAEDGEPPLLINRYFLDHPGCVLGHHARTSSPFGPTYTCLPSSGRPLETALSEAVDRLPRGVYASAAPAPASAADAARLRVGTAAEGATIKEGSYVVVANELMQIVDGVPQKVSIRHRQSGEGIPRKHARIIRHLIPIRDAVRDVLRRQEANEPWEVAQVRLRVAYSGFVRNFGPINLTTFSESTDPDTGETREIQRRPNLQPFLDDPDVWLISAIEDYDLEAGRARQGPIFSERVLHPPARPLIESAADALAVTLHQVGHVDLDHVAELLGRPRADVEAELGDAVFLNPSLSTKGVEVWETADAYLSGAVRTKLAAAEASALLDPRFRRNVEALKRVQPADLKPSEISARLGAPWIPAEVIEAFSGEAIGISTRIRHIVEIALWTLDTEVFAGHAAATSEWGTARRHAGLLLHDALNASIPQIYDVWFEDGKERRELNTAETEAAKEKLAKIKAAFEHWAWTDADRTDRLARIYNDRFNNLVPRHFDGSHLQLPGASSVVRFYDHQKRVIWRVISAGSTYIAHSVGAGKTFAIAAAIMEQKRLGLITKAMMAVPGHCLAQASREFLILYPNARILVADETNFIKEKRQRFLARAATAQWDCIIITHSAFKFISTPAAFERLLIEEQLTGYKELLERLDGEDRLSRKRIERMAEGLEAKLEALQSHKDDLLTIAEIGVDQIIVDEAQEFRKLSFATNMSSLKGVDPDGSQRAWDLYVKSRFVSRKNPDRALILSSGTPITNTLGEMFTLQRFMQPAALQERGIHEFDAWASTFGDTRTELELQPSGLYKPVTRFSEFVNVPELMAMYRTVADVVLRSDLRQHLRLPAVAGGERQVVTAAASPAFKAYQRFLGQRIKAIEARKGPPKKGDDILLSVITDGRHAAIDMRFVLRGYDDEPENKLNALIYNVYRIWRETSHLRYSRPDGIPYALPGASQMIFSDLGTLNVEATRGFSAYRWIKDRLVALGVPPGQIAFIQDHKKAAAKLRFVNDLNAGRIRIAIGSSETMGTGVNGQRRLKALHHLDVPWLPSQIEQREGRIERQGNENDEIEICAYATTGSVDATSWGLLTRKARFIEIALRGDSSVRRIEDIGSQANQFAMAKAIASGDPRLLQKAGLESDIARLSRLRAAHFDDQHAVRRAVADVQNAIAFAERRIRQIEADIARRVPTRGDAFAIEIEGKTYTDRKAGGAALLKTIRAKEIGRTQGEWTVGAIGGFVITASTHLLRRHDAWVALALERTGYAEDIDCGADVTALGIVSRLEHQLGRFEVELLEQRRNLAESRQRLPAYEQRLGRPFVLEAELAAKRAELAAIDASLAATTDEPPAA
jgi:N12 class adenine-specific DNA methylase/adenine-specific DNA methylase